MKSRASYLLALVAGLGLSLASGNVVADTKVPAVAAAKADSAKAPMLMTDSQLANVVAGYDSKIVNKNPPGHTIVWTSGGTTSGGQLIGGSTCYFVSGSGNISNKPCP